MPNKDVHRPVGVVVGGGYAYLRANSQPLGHRIFETIGGAGGGWVGAALPDFFDPATSPNHRHYGHGAATVAGVIGVTAEFLLDLQQRMRRRADQLARDRFRLSDDLARLLSYLEELMLRLLVGFLNGLTAGYVSHLALDSLTPSGLPLFARGY